MKKQSSVKVLLVPDKIWGPDSGAVSARYTVKVLQELNYRVGVYAYPRPENEYDERRCEAFDFYPRFPSSGFNHFYGGKVKKEFEKVLNDFQPDYVFFAGAVVNKPASFFNACLFRKIPTLVLFYINDYYCSRIYAGLPNGPCFKCIQGNYLHALWNGCQIQKPRALHLIKDVAIRWKLRPALLNCSKAFGYSNDQISLYQRYGISPNKCIKCSVFFDRRTIQGIESEAGDYFILCGQSRMEKGWHVISAIVSLCPTVCFKFVFANKLVAKDNIQKFGLESFVDTGHIEVVTDVSNHSDLISLLAASKGVLIPSYYPTTGEFILMESLGLGKPVIVFDAGIHAEVIRSGENGLMVKVGDIEGYAAHVRALNTDINLYSKISAGACQLFEELNSQDGFRLALQAAIGLPHEI